MRLQILPNAADFEAEILGAGKRFDLVEIQSRAKSVEEDDGFDSTRHSAKVNRVMQVGVVEVEISTSHSAGFAPRPNHVARQQRHESLLDVLSVAFRQSAL